MRQPTDKSSARAWAGGAARVQSAARVQLAARERQSRPLQPVYAVIFLDAIHCTVRQEGHVARFPQSDVQECIARQIQNSLKYVSCKEPVLQRLQGRHGVS